MHFSTRSGSRSLQPSASSTSAEPDLEDTLLFPCFAMLTPAPDAIRPAQVEMLKVCEESPPVPQVSTSLSALGEILTACFLITEANAAISSSLSPFIRRATSREAVCAGV